jgi:hypothetical protein
MIMKENYEDYFIKILNSFQNVNQMTFLKDQDENQRKLSLEITWKD